jgi:L-ascorbate metabolism protein UlaG (beta-lactamase superfamily)
MDVPDAIECANMVQCDTIIGVHYDTFGFIKIDQNAAVKAFADAGKRLLLPAIGETISIQ